MASCNRQCGTNIQFINQNGEPITPDNGTITIPSPPPQIKASGTSPLEVVPEFGPDGTTVTCYRINWVGTVTPDRTQLLAADGQTVLIDFTPYL